MTKVNGRAAGNVGEVVLAARTIRVGTALRAFANPTTRYLARGASASSAPP
jgi:hypothetical protein